MYFSQINILGENFVGLFGIATDKFAILSKNFPIQKVFNVPTIRIRIYGTNLIGIFCAGNSNGLLLPYFVVDSEIKELKKELKEFDINISRIEDKYNAIGNLIACNDKGAIISPKISNNRKSIEDTLGVESAVMKIAGREEVGSCIVATNKGFLTHIGSQEQIKEISNVLKVNGMTSSVNSGFPFVRSGVIANSYGYITGMRTTGIELNRIDDALGFF